jgi:hypothetical protein
MDNLLRRYYETTYKKNINNCMKFLFITRGKEFQEDCIRIINGLINRLNSLKQKAIKRKDEDSANFCLCLISFADAIKNELQMWISFKEDRMGDAWEFLVKSEMEADTAISAYSTDINIISYLNKLLLLEKVLFPPHLFFSPGFLIKSSICTICGKEYGTCDHLKGLPYMGEICAREIVDMEIQEISIVEDPANKLAHLVTISDDTKQRDVFTWREVPHTN